MNYFLFVFDTKHGLTHRVIQAESIGKAKELLSDMIDEPLDYNIMAFQTTAPVWRTVV